MRALQLTHRKQAFWFCIVFGIAVFENRLAVGAKATTAIDDQAAVDLTLLSESDLVDRLDFAPGSGFFFGKRYKSGHYEAILSELIRRGTPLAEKALRAKFERHVLEQKKAQEALDKIDSHSDGEAWRTQYAVVGNWTNQLVLLTAIRRLQKRPDPLVVEVKTVDDFNAWRRRQGHLGSIARPIEPNTLKNVESNLVSTRKILEWTSTRFPKDWHENNFAFECLRDVFVQCLKLRIGELETDAKSLSKMEKLGPRAVEHPLPQTLVATASKLPTLIVILKSADVEKLPARIKMGGDYRSGREARWRFEVKGANGEILPVRPFDGPIGGGVFQRGELKPGETWKTALPMCSFVDIPKPGEYMVSVLYHNGVTIADIKDHDDLKELIVFRSKPFKLKVVK